MTYGDIVRSFWEWIRQREAPPVKSNNLINTAR